MASARFYNTDEKRKLREIAMESNKDLRQTLVKKFHNEHPERTMAGINTQLYLFEREMNRSPYRKTIEKATSNGSVKLGKVNAITIKTNGEIEISYK